MKNPSFCILLIVLMCLSMMGTNSFAEVIEEDGARSSGTIDRINSDTNEIVIGDTLYYLADNLVYYSSDGRQTSSKHFSMNMKVSYMMNSDDLIIILKETPYEDEKSGYVQSIDSLDKQDGSYSVEPDSGQLKLENGVWKN